MNRIREDVHIHATAGAIFERLALPEAVRWLPASFRDARAEAATDGADTADIEVLAFRLALPMLDRHVELRIHEEVAPHVLSLRAHVNGSRPAVEAFDWGLHQEGANNVHVTAEFAYEPAGGPFGALLEAAVHAPLRRQALRDALWRLKLLAEGQV
ncbi:MAG: hypothetical protein IT299_04960, partial [Dehalococcoidia bacterium]|nr:hypothetical protein [Dehalococcoidia bacterium]